jgi:hypothetical protein
MKITQPVPLCAPHSLNTTIGLATSCLQRLCHVYPIEESLSSVARVNELLAESSIACVRTGLLILAIFYEALGAEMQAFSPQVLLSFALQSDPFARSSL